MSKKLPLTGFLLSLLLSTTVNSAPNYKSIIGFPGKNGVNSNVTKVQKGLGKISAVTALKWQQIGATHFNAGENQGSSEPWVFLSRDTSIFDNSGNLIVSKSTYAHTGWKTDSLTMLDSSVYRDGKMIENISKYNYPSMSVGMDGYRIVNEYLNGGKTVVSTSYDFNSSGNTWDPVGKDSIIFKNAITNLKMDSYFVFEEYHSFLFDSTDTWTIAGFLTKINSECNATTLTFGGKFLENDSSTILSDEKLIYSFKNSDMTFDNLSSMVEQIKNRSTGTYYDAFKSTISTDVNGTKTNRTTEMDSTSTKVLSDYKSVESLDSHGNDTLHLNAEYDTASHSWDSSSIYRSSRIYDNNGNNSETVVSLYNSFDNSWFVSGKDINLFTQIDVPVIRLNKISKKQSISIMSKGTIVSVMAPEVTGLMIYNANGRLITSLKQNAASSISIDLSASKINLAAGVYMAKAICKNGQYNMKLSINR